eukprot:TRINITY_DN778065_c0_g1_i1.p1 TRINITY_DN778065_c0_g1~~TRINITY_DN778065_c0_g1_i1.p1  ORF type:complete len:290 (-),score=95.92 TRINITY_DN778065_c0_g1_i1:182-1051(-)
MATVLDGKGTAAKIRHDIHLKVDKMEVKPGLVGFLVGDRHDTQTYFRMKERACKDAGIRSEKIVVPADVSEIELASLVKEQTQRPDIHGVFVQHPLPEHLNETELLDNITLDKDVDGLHPINSGKLLLKNLDPLYLPCCAKGILRLLKEYSIDVSGKRAVILGRSAIVGVPVAASFMEQNATITICHSKTKDIESIIKQADILVVCIGEPSSIKGSMIKPGTVVIDVGFNRVEDDSERGYHIEGDVDFESMLPVASHINPVPGGIGPMTIAMVMENVLLSAERKAGIVE